MSQPELTAEQILGIALESSTEQVIGLSKRSNVSLEDFTPALPVLGHWMTFIFISGEAFRLLFKTHYSSQNALILAERTYDSDAVALTSERALDFMKEYCNLAAGAMKRRLERYGLNSGVSLPSTTRGFDELFFRRTAKTSVHYWALNCDQTKLICSAEIEILGKVEVNEVADVKEAAPESGEIEFF